MTVQADTRQRELVKCDGCGQLEYHWKRLVLSIDGAVVLDKQVCRRCETDAEFALKNVWRGLETKPKW